MPTLRYRVSSRALGWTEIVKANWPLFPLQDADEARRIFDEQSARLLPGTEQVLVVGGAEDGTAETSRPRAVLPSEDDCERWGPPKLPWALFKLWTLREAIRGAYWAYRLVVPSKRLLARRDSLLRIAKLVETEIGELADGLSDADVEDPRFGAIWHALAQVPGAVAAAGLGLSLATGEVVFNVAAVERPLPGRRALVGLSARNVAGALLLHWGLHELLVGCALVALDLLDEDDRIALDGGGLYLQYFAGRLRKMRNRQALVEIGLGALYPAGLLGLPSPETYAVSGGLGLLDTMVRSIIRDCLPLAANAKLNRAGWATTRLGEQEFAALGWPPDGDEGGWAAAPVALVLGEVSEFFRAKRGREIRPTDIATEIPWMVPLTLRLRGSLELAEAHGSGSRAVDLLSVVSERFGDDVALQTAAVVALRCRKRT